MLDTRLAIEGFTLLVIFCAVAAGARASVWEGPLWALSAQADSIVGYDSNIFAVDGGPSDSFATFKPLLGLSRKDSLLSFETDAWTSFTAFQRDTGTDSIDPGFLMKLSFPANVDAMTTQSAEVHWVRTTAVNLDVGGRVSQDDALARYEGDVLDSGKTSVALRASLERDEYLGAAFSTNNTASLGATASYSPHELFRAGLGYDLTLGRSVANTPGMGALDLAEQAFTFQASGEFTPKVTGKVSVGAADSDYWGSFSHSEWDSVAGADVTWRPADRLSLDLQVRRGPYFNTNGDIDMSSSVALVVRHELSGGFSAWASGTAGNTDHDRVVTYRSDAIEGAAAGLDYDLTGRLTASFGYAWTKQLSDVATYTYTRDVVTLQLTSRF
jgi:hypothetical protein